MEGREQCPELGKSLRQPSAYPALRDRNLEDIMPNLSTRYLAKQRCRPFCWAEDGVSAAMPGSSQRLFCVPCVSALWCRRDTTKQPYILPL